MSLQTPWDLATTLTFPPTVEVWALTALPQVPVDWASVVASRETRAIVQASIGSPTINDLGTFAFNTLSLVVTGPEDPAQYPLRFVAFAIVDTTSPGFVLGYFAAPGPVQLQAMGQSYNLQSTFIVAREAP